MIRNMKNVLILGRYNKDINELMDKVEYKDMNLRYLTIHKAKGLEEDNVILINMTNKINGFPSKIEEEKITKKIFKSKEKYPYCEERRRLGGALRVINETPSMRGLFYGFPHKNAEKCNVNYEIPDIHNNFTQCQLLEITWYV